LFYGRSIFCSREQYSRFNRFYFISWLLFTFPHWEFLVRSKDFLHWSLDEVALNHVGYMCCGYIINALHLLSSQWIRRRKIKIYTCFHTECVIYILSCVCSLYQAQGFYNCLKTIIIISAYTRRSLTLSHITNLHRPTIVKSKM